MAELAKFAFPASLTTNGNGVSVVTAFNVESDTPVYVADSRHPAWDDILEGLTSGDPKVWDLFDVAGGMMNKFRQVTDRVSWDGEQVLWDGDPIHTVLSEQLSRALEDGNPDNYVALANFWEKLESNPNEHSRQQAYEFLATHEFQITPDGDVVGYKGVTENADGSYSSVASSRVADKPSAYVNGKALPPLSRVTQNLGDLVTMPRSEVAHNPHLFCNRGLHVATRDYASSYGTVLEVHVNPRDICSVPNDARGEKVRVNRYKVARVAVEPHGGPVLRQDDNVWVGDVGYAGI